MDLFEKFFQVLKALKEKKVDYILIGGFAVILHDKRDAFFLSELLQKQEE